MTHGAFKANNDDEEKRRKKSPMGELANALQGLDHVFDATPPRPGTELITAEIVNDMHQDGGLTLKQAVYYYNLPADKIKQGIRAGQIPGVKLAGKKGEKWRVFPNGVPASFADTVVVKPESKSCKHNVVDVDRGQIDRLVHNVARLNDELSTAFHLIAELQSQIVRSRHEIQSIAATLSDPDSRKKQ